MPIYLILSVSIYIIYPLEKKLLICLYLIEIRNSTESRYNISFSSSAVLQLLIESFAFKHFSLKSDTLDI